MTQETTTQPQQAEEPTIHLSLTATQVAKVIAGLRNVADSKELMKAIDVPQVYEMPLSAVNQILAGLGFLMFRDSADVIATIKQQGDEQMIAHLTGLSKDAGKPDESKGGE